MKKMLLVLCVVAGLMFSVNSFAKPVKQNDTPAVVEKEKCKGECKCKCGNCDKEPGYGKGQGRGKGQGQGQGRGPRYRGGR